MNITNYYYLHRLTNDEVKQLFADIKIDQDGMFDYADVIRTLTMTPEDPDANKLTSVDK